MQLKDGKALTPTGHLLWKAENAELKRRLKAYKELGVKKVVRETGKTEWYGCSKKSQRCFGSVSALGLALKICILNFTSTRLHKIRRNICCLVGGRLHAV
jgi:hypothetical protein